MRSLRGTGVFLEPQDQAHIIAGAAFDDLQRLEVSGETLQHLVAEGMDWMPRELVVAAPGPLAFDVAAMVAAAPRLEKLHLGAGGLSVGDLRRLERPGLVVSC